MTICGPFMVIHVDNISQSNTTRLNRFIFNVNAHKLLVNSHK